jgi:hypothetical protein
MNDAADIKTRRRGMIRRRVFSTLSATLLFFCAMTLLAWLRSYWVLDDIRRASYAITSTNASVNSVEFYSAGGKLCLVHIALKNPNTTNAMSGVVWNWNTDIYPPRSVFPWPPGGPASFSVAGGGFGLAIWPTRAWPGFSSHGIEILLPYWGVAGILVIPPAWRAVLIQRRKRRLKLAGCCRRCGYDLRATPDRCPECGTPVPKDLRSGISPKLSA